MLKDLFKFEGQLQRYSMLGAVFAVTLFVACGGATDEDSVGIDSEKIASVEQALRLPDNDDCDVPYLSDYEDPMDGNEGPCCGDNVCDPGEEYYCSEDCSYCGDGTCNSNESPSSCSTDCGTCGNHTCESTENAASCPTDCAIPTRVRLDRVRRCTKKFLCMGKITYPEYRVWEDEGVKKRHQRNTYIAKLLDPPKARVKHLVFIAAGQQLPRIRGISKGRGQGQSSMLTGQRYKYKSTFSRRDKSKWVNIDKGLAHKIISNSNIDWDLNETFVGLAFDAKFNFEYSNNEKLDIEAAYYKWLKGKFYSSQIKSIYLAGHSRGGCLAARLGAKFSAEFPNVTVIIHPFDGVCSPSYTGGELGVLKFLSITNPLNSNYFAFPVDLSAQYPNQTNLAFFNQISGAPVIDSPLLHETIENNFRAFSDIHAGAENYNSGGTRPWLEQKWWTYSHMGMENWPVQNSAVDHIVETCTHLTCW